MKKCFFGLFLIIFSVEIFAQNHLLYCLRSLDRVSESNGFFYSHIGKTIYLFDSKTTAAIPFSSGVFRFGQMEILVEKGEDSLNVSRLLKPSLDFIKESKLLVSDKNASDDMLSFLKSEMELFLAWSEKDLKRGKMPKQIHQKSILFCQQALDQEFFFSSFGPRVNRIRYEIFEASKKFNGK